MIYRFKRLTISTKSTGESSMTLLLRLRVTIRNYCSRTMRLHAKDSEFSPWGYRVAPFLFISIAVTDTLFWFQDHPQMLKFFSGGWFVDGDCSDWIIDNHYSWKQDCSVLTWLISQWLIIINYSTVSNTASIVTPRYDSSKPLTTIDHQWSISHRTIR